MKRRRPAPRSSAERRNAADRSPWVVGFHAVLGALEHAPRRVEVVWLLERREGRNRRILEVARRAGVRHRTVGRRELDEIAAGLAHNGFAARLSPSAMSEPEELLEGAGPSCVIGLDGVEDGHNLGAVIRLAAGLGLAGVVVAGPHPPPLTGATAKVAAGTVPLVRVARVGSLGDYAARAKDAGYWVIGAAADGDLVAGTELPDRVLLCLGAEARGLRAKTRRALDAVVAIPLAAGVESLNLSVAAGILAWEWRRHYPLSPAGSVEGEGA